MARVGQVPLPKGVDAVRRGMPMTEVDNDVDPAEDARLACERLHGWAAMARAGWERKGSPFTIVHQNGTQGVHPLWKALRQAELSRARAHASSGRVPTPSR